MDFRLRSAVWEITNACNANCIHCGSKSGQERQHELSESEALQVCKDLAELGCEWVSLIGGEIFLSPYWEKICQEMTDSGIRVCPLTNGILATNTNLDKLIELGVNNISFSLDGMAEIHDYIRGVPGIFKKAVKNMSLAQEKGLKVGVNTAFSALNLDQIYPLYELLVDHKVPVWQVQIVEDMGNASENPELSLKLEQLYRLARDIAELRQREEIRINVAHNIGWFCSFEPLIRPRPFTGCLAGKGLVGIQSNGDVRGCLSLMSGEPQDNVEGNLRQRSLVEIWNDPDCFANFRYRTQDDLTGDCQDCKYGRICLGGCSSVAYSLIRKFTENPFCLHLYEEKNNIFYSEVE